MCHLMFGILALTANQMMILVTWDTLSSFNRLIFLVHRDSYALNFINMTTYPAN
jgi:hypothetical protein